MLLLKTSSFHPQQLLMNYLSDKGVGKPNLAHKYLLMKQSPYLQSLMHIPVPFYYVNVNFRSLEWNIFRH